MKSVTQVQILDETFWTSHHVNIMVEGINPSVLHLAISWSSDRQVSLALVY